MTTRPGDGNGGAGATDDDDDPTKTGGTGAGAGGNGGTGDDDDSDDDDFDKPRALGTIRTLREESKQAKQRAVNAEKRLKELEDVGKSELERAKAENEQLKAENAQHALETKTRVTRETFVSAAQKAGAVKPEALFKLADGLEIDGDGKPTNTTAVIKKLREDYPELFGGGGSADGGTGRGQGTKPQGMSDLIRASRGIRAGGR
jgi:hypothetical protein